MIVGPANCGKTFMLKPLEHIYHAFCNPANVRYAWIDADQAKVIVFQDFRWSLELICWKDLLFPLGGELPSPKNQFGSDACINKDIPIFATNKSKIEHVGKHSNCDKRETKMMDVRWKIFEIYHRIPQ